MPDDTTSTGFNPQLFTERPGTTPYTREQLDELGHKTPDDYKFQKLHEVAHAPDVAARGEAGGSDPYKLLDIAGNAHPADYTKYIKPFADMWSRLDPRTLFTLAGAIGGRHTFGGKVGNAMAGLMTQQKQEAMGAAKQQLEMSKLGMELQQMYHSQKEIPDDLADKWGVPHGTTYEDLKTEAPLLKAHGLSSLGKEVEEYNALPKDSPLRDLYKKKMEGEKEPDNPFKTFKAGFPKNEGESETSYNARLSKAWGDEQAREAGAKTTASGEAKAKLRQEELSSAGRELLIQVGGQQNLDMLYERYVKFGEQPAMGMGNNQRWAFLGGAMQWAREHGLDTKAVQIGKMQTKAAQQALDNITKVETVSRVAGETAIKHGETALKLMDVRDRSGVPVVDRWIRAGMKEVAGDKEVTDFNLAIHMFQRELTRYLTSMTAGGQMHQEESNQIQKLIDPAQPPETIASNYQTAVDLIKQKEQTFKEQKQELMEAVGNSDGEKGGGESESGDSPPINLLREGQITPFKDGSAWELRNGKAVRVN